MKRKNLILSTIILIIVIVAILVVYFIYKSSNNQNTYSSSMNSINTASEFSTHINSSTTEVTKIDTNSTPSLINNTIENNTTYSSSFVLNDENKYIVTTDSIWKTMQDDGGSNINIYYQINLDSNIVTKKQDNFHASLLGDSTTETTTLYTKTIDDNLHDELKNLFTDIFSQDDSNQDNNYDGFYTIENSSTEKNIYDFSLISKTRKLLLKIDSL